MSERRHRKLDYESENTSFSICGQEMILYPRQVLYEVMSRKKNQRVGKVCHYHYKATAMRRRIAADVSHDVTKRAIRTVGRRTRRPVHREQSLEEVSSSPRPHFSVQVRSVLYQHTTNMSTAAATAVTRAARESIQNTNAPTRLHVPSGDNKKNNLLFSAQCSDNDSTEVLLEPSQQQQCYLNSTYDYLFQRHVDTLNKVISESAAGQNQILDKNNKQQNQKVKQSSGGAGDQKVDFAQQQQQQQKQQIRISVSSSEESAGTSQDVSSLASEERRSPPAASDCCLGHSTDCKDIENTLESLNIDPDKPRIVLSQQQTSSDSAQLLNSTTRRSRSPSPLLEVPVESVDISREIRRPPIQ